MELEFDKEIDAILRRARTGGAVDTVKAGHIDADAVAAFAENALPEKARLLYMEHFADCGRCRKLLSESMAWPPAEPKATTVAAPVAEAGRSWLSGLFRTPNLAMAMGALVVVFAGILGYVAIRNRGTSDVNAVARVSEGEAPRGPYAEEPGLTSANSLAANVTANANRAEPLPGGLSNTAITGSGTATGTGSVGRGPLTGSDTAQPESPSDEVAPKVGAAAPPPPVAVTSETVTREERKDDADKERGRDLKLSKAEDDRSVTRDAAPMAKKSAGPTMNRAAGPRQNTQDYNMNQQAIGGVPAKKPATIKNAGGKKFEFRDGAWYDTSYGGQATRNVNRSSEDYRKLDSGLRSIASSIGGVVVVMWSGKAYRIQ